ncbi:SURF1 family protein [Flexivirga sp. ID2601S]|uniref:SURF1-like protein n=1 Tax=Flexivirga aerilata TaxID=1656889 RepID=A0A849AJS8_9MICO|nr:SURF1 family protein [Flexivirga aerilata]
MLRVLLTRRWLTWLLVAVVWAIACVFLGRWQWHRYESKSLAQHQVSDNYNGTPVSVDSVLKTPDATLTQDDKWTQVRLVGRYDDGKRLLARNRPNNSYYGYEVLIPFRQNDGSTVLVDRGWIDNGPTAAAPASVPATPGGEVTITGWLLPGEKAAAKQSVTGQVSSINLPEIRRVTGDPIHTGGYVLMRSEKTANGAVPAKPAPLPKPDPGSYAGINLSYAIQWWAAAVCGFGFLFYRIRREHLDATRGPRPRKPKKVRIWDEEDE